MAGDWIKLNRSLLKWGWYKDANTMRVFMDILLNANYHDGEYMGHPVLTGQCVIGRKALAERLGMSERSVRTALNHLKSTNEITIKSTNRFSIVTIENWSKYQCEECDSDQQNDQQAVNQATNNRPASDHIQEIKNVISKEIKSGTIIPPSLEDVSKYCSERNNNVDPQAFVDFYESKGWMVGSNKMKNWKASVRTWEKRSKPKKPENNEDWKEEWLNG